MPRPPIGSTSCGRTSPTQSGRSRPTAGSGTTPSIKATNVGARWATLAQYGHRTGIRPDYAMSTHERDEKIAAGHLAAEEKRLGERREMLPAAERGEANALEKVRPQAEAKLVELQQRAALAHEVQQEKMQEQKERDQAQEREREHKLDRDRGMER